MAYYRKSPPKKKYPEQPFDIHKLCEGHYYYNPRIVGVTFQSELAEMTRSKLIKRFLENHGDEISLELLPDARGQWLIDLCTVNEGKELLNAEEEVGKYISLVSEPDNQYDPNAIAVFVHDDILKMFVDVGYLPKEHSSKINERFDELFLIGAEGSGRGMMLHIIMRESNYGVEEISEETIKKEEESIVPKKFLTLRQMRRSLEI